MDHQSENEISHLRIDLKDFFENLLEKEEHILKLRAESTGIELLNQQLINSNRDSLNQLKDELLNLREQSIQDELSTSAYDSERIKKFYERKNDLFIKLIDSAKFYVNTEQTILDKSNGKRTIEEVDDQQSDKSTSNKRSKMMLEELMKCETGLTSCFEMINQFESKHIQVKKSKN